MPKKLTLAQVAKMARAKDAAAWDSLSPAEQRVWVHRLNEKAAADAKHQTALRNVDRVQETLRRAARPYRKKMKARPVGQ